MNENNDNVVAALPDCEEHDSEVRLRFFDSLPRTVRHRFYEANVDWCPICFFDTSDLKLAAVIGDTATIKREILENELEEVRDFSEEYEFEWGFPTAHVAAKGKFQTYGFRRVQRIRRRLSKIPSFG